MLQVINGCTLESLQDRLEKGNLPKKEIERTKKANEKEFPDGIPECGSDALRFGLLAYTVSIIRSNGNCTLWPSNIIGLGSRTRHQFGRLSRRQLSPVLQQTVECNEVRLTVC
jgi:hypothetical protein